MGIVDDVTFSSLPYGAEPEVLPPGTTECLFWGMGSDGTVGANKEAVKIIASQEGMNAQVGGASPAEINRGARPATQLACARHGPRQSSKRRPC